MDMQPAILVEAELGDWPSFDVLHSTTSQNLRLVYFSCMTFAMFELNNFYQQFPEEEKYQNAWFVMKTGRSGTPYDTREKILL